MKPNQLRMKLVAINAAKRTMMTNISVTTNLIAVIGRRPGAFMHTSS